MYRHLASGKVVKPDTGAKCARCRKDVDVEELTLIDKLYHVPPSGCTDGDYWTHSEYAFRCPHCNVINRLLGVSHERNRWASHPWNTQEPRWAGPVEKCTSYEWRNKNCPLGCRSVFTPLLSRFAKREELDKDYDGEWCNNEL